MRRRADERGVTALEFGLVSPIIFLLIFGIIQYGYLFWSLTTASATAREAARRMVVGHDWATCTLPRAVAHAESPAVGSNPVQVTYRYTDEAGTTLTRPPAPGDLVEVTVSFDVLDLHIPILPLPDGGVVSEDAVARVETVPSSPPPCDTPGNP